MAKQAGCPTLATYLFLSLGWAGGPGLELDRPLFHKIGCPILGTSLFLCQGWDSTALSQTCS